MRDSISARASPGPLRRARVGNAVAQTAMAATNAESNARSFRSSSREMSHQPSYVRMLAMMPFSLLIRGEALGHGTLAIRCDGDHTERCRSRRDHGRARSAARVSSRSASEANASIAFSVLARSAAPSSAPCLLVRGSAAAIGDG
jgi:hypothetical protein